MSMVPVELVAELLHPAGWMLGPVPFDRRQGMRWQRVCSRQQLWKMQKTESRN